MKGRWLGLPRRRGCFTDNTLSISHLSPMSKAGYERLNNLPTLKHFRKKLRSNMTPAEAKLWTYLKGKQLEGKKFRRQHSVSRYILEQIKAALYG